MRFILNLNLPISQSLISIMVSEPYIQTLTYLFSLLPILIYSSFPFKNHDTNSRLIVNWSWPHQPHCHQPTSPTSPTPPMPPSGPINTVAATNRTHQHLRCHQSTLSTLLPSPTNLVDHLQLAISNSSSTESSHLLALQHLHYQQSNPSIPLLPLIEPITSPMSQPSPTDLADPLQHISTTITDHLGTPSNQFSITCLFFVLTGQISIFFTLSTYTSLSFTTKNVWVCRFCAWQPHWQN